MTATLGGLPVMTASVNVPRYGRTRAEVTLEGGAAPTAGQRYDLVIANLTLVGMTVLPGRTGLDASYAPACVLLQGAGWDTALPSPPPSWQSDAGVPVRTVLDRLARIAGETWDAATLPAQGTLIGSRVALRAGTCAQALDGLVLQGYLAPWWVAPDGTTKLGARPMGASDARTYEIARNDSMYGVRRVRLSTNAAGLLPGNTIENVVISRVVFTLTPQELTARTWA